MRLNDTRVSFKINQRIFKLTGNRCHSKLANVYFAVSCDLEYSLGRLLLTSAFFFNDSHRSKLSESATPLYLLASETPTVVEPTSQELPRGLIKWNARDVAACPSEKSTIHDVSALLVISKST
jgi:hypothetical protein